MSHDLPKIGERVEKASRFVPHCQNLLDVGCGDGIISYFVEGRVENIYGVDNSRKLLDKARKRGVHVKNADLDKEKIPFSSNKFDVLTCLDVIEHVKDPKLLLHEMYRVLKKQGLLILSTPNIRFSDHIYQLAVKGLFPKTSLDPEFYDGGHIHFFTYTDMHILLNQAGFTHIQDEEIINKEKRGWKGRFIQMIVGAHIMREFRTPGILLIARK